MPKLLGRENVGGLIHSDYLHVGDDGKDKITTVTSQDASSIIQNVKLCAQTPGKDIRLRAKIPVNIVNEACRQAAASWGTTTQLAFAEMMSAKTDRSKELWRTLTDGRDFRKLQVKNYVS
jgi:hypothetical protein